MRKMYKHINYIIALASAVVMVACAELDLEKADEHEKNHIPQVTIKSPLGGVDVQTGDVITFIRVISDKEVLLKYTYTGTPDTIKFGATDLHGTESIKKYGYPGEYRVFLTNAKSISLSKEGLFNTNVVKEKSTITGDSTLYIANPRNDAETIKLYETGIIKMFDTKDYTNDIKFEKAEMQKVSIKLNVNSPTAVRSIEAEITGIPTSFSSKYIKRDEFATVKLNLNGITAEGDNNYSASDAITVPTVYCENTDDVNNVIKAKVTLVDGTIITGYLNTWRVINKNYISYHYYGEDLYKYSDNEEYLISTTKNAELDFFTLSIEQDENGAYVLKTPAKEDASLEWQSLK